jgi:endonuclease YncB( thermonuclease family)
MFVRIAINLLICLLPAIAIAHPGGVDAKGCHRDSAAGARHCHPERAGQAGKNPSPVRERPPQAGDEGVFYGPFVSVVDGDTFKAKVQGVVMKFRLQGIDAPERDQPYGSTSTAVLDQLIRKQNLVLVFSDVDAYGRIVTQAWVGNLNVNAEMARRGAAWFDAEYSDDDQLYRVETAARNRKAGLWALPAADRVEPRIWRKKKRSSKS